MFMCAVNVDYLTSMRYSKIIMHKDIFKDNITPTRTVTWVYIKKTLNKILSNSYLILYMKRSIGIINKTLLVASVSGFIWR